MMLGALSLLIRRKRVPIRNGELAVLGKELARARNHVLSRGMQHARAQIWVVARSFLVLGLGLWLGWTPAGILLFLLFNAVLSVLIDGMRYGLASRWVHYSHAREHRVEEVLAICRTVERGETVRLAGRLKPKLQPTLVLSGILALLVLPIVAISMTKLGVLEWKAVLSNLFLPVLMIGVFVTRSLRALLWVTTAKTGTVGTRDVFLESDDSIDVIAGVLALSWLFLLFGQVAALVIVVLVCCARLAYRIHRWWWLRTSLDWLSKRQLRLHPRRRRERGQTTLLEVEDVDFSEADLNAPTE